MPLKSGYSQEVISKNVREMIIANKRKSPEERQNRKQIIRRALDKAREGKKEQGKELSVADRLHERAYGRRKSA